MSNAVFGSQAVRQSKTTWGVGSDFLLTGILGFRTLFCCLPVYFVFVVVA